jgi:putative GTP pyrophosphokinase
VRNNIPSVIARGTGFDGPCPTNGGHHEVWWALNKDTWAPGGGRSVNTHNDFDSEYSRATAPLPALGTALESLIGELLAANRIPVHRVEHRVKSRESAAGKAARKLTSAGEPRLLDSFTDLLGLRVITYFRDAVDDASRLIEREFTIDARNSVDKRAALDPDQFGYLSTHYVAQLNQERVALPGFQSYRGLKFEIQIRSILQHAWAEIEHDLGYKSEEALPRILRRRFSRLAGLLELADDEFVAIRQEAGQHQSTASETIEQGSLEIEIDQDSLSAFALASPQLRQLGEEIARHMNGTVQDQPDGEFIRRQAVQLKALGFHSIEDLSNFINKNRDALERFTLDRLRLIEHKPRVGRVLVPVGVTLHYVGMFKSAQELRAGNDLIQAYAGISHESLLQSLWVATNGTGPLPGV